MVSLSHLSKAQIPVSNTHFILLIQRIPHTKIKSGQPLLTIALWYEQLAIRWNILHSILHSALQTPYSIFLYTYQNLTETKKIMQIVVSTVWCSTGFIRGTNWPNFKQRYLEHNPPIFLYMLCWMIKIDRYMSELWRIVYKIVTLILMYLLVLLHEMSCSLCGYQTWSFILRKEHTLKVIVVTHTRTHVQYIYVTNIHTHTHRRSMWCRPYALRVYNNRVLRKTYRTERYASVVCSVIPLVLQTH
jgi:hypothetical protein